MGALDSAFRTRAGRRVQAAATTDGIDVANVTRSARPAARPLRRAPRLATAVLAVAVGLLMADAAVTWRGGAPARARVDAALTAERDLRSADVAALSGRARTLRVDIDAARAALLVAQRDRRTADTAIEALEPAAAALPARGPGLRIDVVDAGPAGPTGQASPETAGPGRPGGPGQPGAAVPGARGQSQLADHDLADLVNALWSGRARAITVGGVRLSATTPIRTAGEAILVGFQPISSPYRIEAVGEPAQLLAAFFGSAAGGRLADDHLAGARLGAVTTMRGLTLPAAALAPPRLARRQSQ